MAVFLHVLLIIAIIIICFFVLSFVVYFFNLDMKLTAALEPLFTKHYDKIKRNKHL
jgi:phosphotransferase system  glucose/maltose/N-acetylglucosamine-specific IIC component